MKITLRRRRDFRSHPHRDMEILTYVLEGSLEHRDSLGNGGVLDRGGSAAHFGRQRDSP